MLASSAPASRGLCAARVLSDFFDRVSVFERDELPDHAANRPAVPQGGCTDAGNRPDCIHFSAAGHVLSTNHRLRRESIAYVPSRHHKYWCCTTPKDRSAGGIARWAALVDQFLGAAEADPVLAEWFLRRFSLLDCLYMVPSARLVGRVIQHNVGHWLWDRRAARV